MTSGKQQGPRKTANHASQDALRSAPPIEGTDLEEGGGKGGAAWRTRSMRVWGIHVEVSVKAGERGRGGAGRCLCVPVILLCSPGCGGGHGMHVRVRLTEKGGKAESRTIHGLCKGRGRDKEKSRSQ